MKFLKTARNVKSKFDYFSFLLNQRRCGLKGLKDFELKSIDEDEQDASAQFLQMQKDQFAELFTKIMQRACCR